MDQFLDPTSPLVPTGNLRRRLVVNRAAEAGTVLAAVAAIAVLGILIGAVVVGHHLIMFARAASSGRQNASNYSIRLREASVPAE